ncbi:hypothetical protein [Huintestinicola sp.]|uniref:hypothetical protein n=1 Tax=Huintestinicola sp. TaxID=2981661 RepID=UPI003D7C46DF
MKDRKLSAIAIAISLTLCACSGEKLPDNENPTETSLTEAAAIEKTPEADWKYSIVENKASIKRTQVMKPSSPFPKPFSLSEKIHITGCPHMLRLIMRKYAPKALKSSPVCPALLPCIYAARAISTLRA